LFYLFIINPVKINFRGLSFSFIPKKKFRGAFEIMELACAVSYTNRAPGVFSSFVNWAAPSLSVT